MCTAPFHQLLILLLALALPFLAGCGDDSSPLGPAGLAEPVESAGRIAGDWEAAGVFLQGLPLEGLLVPAFAAGRYEAALESFEAGLTATVTGERSGLFAATAFGSAADTADPGRVASGAFAPWGSFTLEGEGLLAVTVRDEGDGAATASPASYRGTASLVGDTLLLEFTLAEPPYHRVGFLPAAASILVRLVRR